MNNKINSDEWKKRIEQFKIIRSILKEQKECSVLYVDFKEKKLLAA